MANAQPCFNLLNELFLLFLLLSLLLFWHKMNALDCGRYSKHNHQGKSSWWSWLMGYIDWVLCSGEMASAYCERHLFCTSQIGRLLSRLWVLKVCVMLRNSYVAKWLFILPCWETLWGSSYARKKRKERTSMCFTWTCDVCSAIHVHAHMSMDVRVNFMPMLISGPWVSS